MAELPRIAVVVPCFNDGATVGEVVRSVRAQESCELVVVDDGSTDVATRTELDRLAADGVCVVHQENAGVSAARNAGVAATTAPYVFAIDADDRLLPGRLTELADLLDEHPEIALVWGRYRTFGEREQVRDVAARLDPWTITYFQDIPASFMVRREALVEVGGWKLRGYEGWEVLVALAELGYEGRGVDTVVYEYRLHPWRKLSRMLPLHDRLHAEIKGLHPDLFARRRENRRRSHVPRLLRIAVPVINVLPIRGLRKQRWWGLAAHVAYRRGGYRRYARRLLREAVPSRRGAGA